MPPREQDVELGLSLLPKATLGLCSSPLLRNLLLGSHHPMLSPFPHPGSSLATLLVTALIPEGFSSWLTICPLWLNFSRLFSDFNVHLVNHPAPWLLVSQICSLPMTTAILGSTSQPQYGALYLEGPYTSMHSFHWYINTWFPEADKLLVQEVCKGVYRFYSELGLCFILLCLVFCWTQHGLVITNGILKFSSGWRPSNTKIHLHQAIHCNIVYNCKILETTEMSIFGSAVEYTVIHLYNRILCDCIRGRKFCMNWVGVTPWI